MANNVRNKILSIRVAAFGFSRGATLARAFAREFQELCSKSTKGGWQLTAGAYPIDFYFLGLWDTVASVGLPMSANNTYGAQSLGWAEAEKGMVWRKNKNVAATDLAFGEPGADPAPGIYDGHMGWADPLDIVPIVSHCVHMIAAHEIRNSFPVDSCRRGTGYPASVQEMAYPGVHSDVGGCYRPGESARSLKPSQMLSLIPLRVVHQNAFEHGVPLFPLNALPDRETAEAFAVDPDSQADFLHMNELWKHYMQTVKASGSIGQVLNAHMELYYKWRFYKIRLNQAATQSGRDTRDAARLGILEAQWRRERTQLETQMKPAKEKMDAAHARWQRDRNALNSAQMRQIETGQTVDPDLIRFEAQSSAAKEGPTDAYLQLKARHDTLPGADGLMAHNLNVYDTQLLNDADAITKAKSKDPSLKLRPHYRKLLNAYFAEFIAAEGLRDAKIIEFFDTYVHDSLAGFARDATLPSDPRVIYVGKDNKSQHALKLPKPSPGDSMAA